MFEDKVMCSCAKIISINFVKFIMIYTLFDRVEKRMEKNVLGVYCGSYIIHSFKANQF